MVPFLRSLIWFSALGTGLAFFLLQFGHTRAPRFPATEERWATFCEKADQLEALVIGNSNACSIDFEALGLDGYSLSKSGLDLFETAFVIRAALERTPNVRMVFIPISYFALRRDNGVGDAYRQGLRQEIYWCYPWTSDLIGGDVSGLVHGNLAPLLRPDNWEAVLWPLYEEPDPVVVDRFGRLDFETWKGTRPAPVLREHAKLWAPFHVELGDEMHAARPSIEADILETLNALCEFLGEREVLAVFFTPPYFKAYTNRYRDAGGTESLARLRKAMHDLARRNEHVFYLDASEEANVIGKAPAFKDSFHLNPDGAAVFSRGLARYLESHGH